MPVSPELDNLARQLYDAKKTVGPPISDSAWQIVKDKTPIHYSVLLKVAEGLMEND